MRSVLVTGATGFVGRFLCSAMVSEGWKVRAAIRFEADAVRLPPGVEPVLVGPINPDTEWLEALHGMDVVVHLAARVHVMTDHSADPLTEFRWVNVAGTGRLAREAARVGVNRLIFVSSIKVNGEETSEPFTPDSLPRPSDPYGISKWEAEQTLRGIETETGLEVVIIRPPLIYGPGVKANFLTMMKTIQRGIFLPLASVSNKRSLIYIGNLVDALSVCAVHPGAAGKTYLVSDGDDVSTPELIRRVARSLGKPARLLPFPTPLLRLVGRITGNKAAFDRLLSSLVVESGNIRLDLDWQPPFTMEEGLKLTSEWFQGAYVR
jgi:nucleoside-diphosphate-sugar epimerase